MVHGTSAREWLSDYESASARPASRDHQHICKFRLICQRATLLPLPTFPDSPSILPFIADSYLLPLLSLSVFMLSQSEMSQNPWTKAGRNLVHFSAGAGRAPCRVLRLETMLQPEEQGEQEEQEQTTEQEADTHSLQPDTVHCRKEPKREPQQPQEAL
jgi:hypothetical protein